MIEGTLVRYRGETFKFVEDDADGIHVWLRGPTTDDEPGLRCVPKDKVLPILRLVDSSDSKKYKITRTDDKFRIEVKGSIP